MLVSPSPYMALDYCFIY